jgi:hypothetical protein
VSTANTTQSPITTPVHRNLEHEGRPNPWQRDFTVTCITTRRRLNLAGVVRRVKRRAVYTHDANPLDPAELSVLLVVPRWTREHVAGMCVAMDRPQRAGWELEMRGE